MPQFFPSPSPSVIARSCGAVIALALGASALAPAAAAPPAEARLVVQHATRAPAPKLAWRRQVKGLISDLDLSANGLAVLAALIPDPDAPGPGGGYRLTRWSPAGRLAWQLKLHAPLKAQALSSDGGLAVASIYDDDLWGIDARGKVLWRTHAPCRPILLERTHQVLCYHDDDAEPRIAFDLFDWKGVKQFSYPITRDILALKVSADERNWALSLSGGQVVRMELAQGRPRALWKKDIGREILDVGVSSGARPRVAVLTMDQGLILLDADGEIVARAQVPVHAEQIELSPAGSAIWVHGHGEQGQYLGRFTGAPKLREAWRMRLHRPAAYPSPLRVNAAGATILVEEESGPRLLGFDEHGLTWLDLTMPDAAGVNLYGRNAGGATVWADDLGKLSFFKAAARVGK